MHRSVFGRREEWLGERSSIFTLIGDIRSSPDIMNEVPVLNADEVVEHSKPCGELADIFATDDRTERLKEFLASYKDVKEIDEPKYYWPTETDPHASEVVSWIHENFDTVFPNIASKSKPL